MTLNPIRRLVRRSSSTQVSETAEEGPFSLRWDTIPAAETSMWPDHLDHLFNRRYDGMTVTGVFTPEELAPVVKTMGEEELIAHPFGGLLGMPLGMIGPGQSRDTYFDDTDRVRLIYRDAFGCDPHARIAEVVAPMASGRPLIAPIETDREYNPGQLRLMCPGQGGLVAHAGNEFRSHHEDGAMSHLITTTAVTDHISYFVVIQRPNEGGGLSVYDLTWEENQGPRDADWANGQRPDGWIERYRKEVIKPEPGDLIMFGGGWRWHRVDPVHGSDRITYGGFCSPSLDGTEIHFWA